MEIRKPKGTNDILPEESLKWQMTEKTMRYYSDVYGYHEIRTPIFEHTELFVRGVGETTDIVGKEMYTFMDKGDRSITLRPEGTASVCRAFIENKMHGEKQVHKLYYMGPMFRYERPQKGRYKQFHQYGVEFLGSDLPVTDAEVITFAVELLSQIGLTDLELQINTVGCPVCKPIYRQVLVDYFSSKKELLCQTCHERMDKNPLRILDCKNSGCIEASLEAPAHVNHACAECGPHFALVKDYLNAAGVIYTENPRLVRGLDYYTNTAFEIVAKDFAAQGTVCGGGRYNGLIGSLGGKDVPGIGFAMGIERIILLLSEKNLFSDNTSKLDYYIIAMGQQEEMAAFSLLKTIRDHCFFAEMDYAGKSFKNKLKTADKSGAKYTVIIGENEMVNQSVTIKNMQTGQQDTIDLQTFVNNLKEAR